MLIDAIYLDKLYCYKCKFDLSYKCPKYIVDKNIFETFNLGDYNLLREVPDNLIGNGILYSLTNDSFIDKCNNIHLE
jgi:hypothetical protein